jgi:hypothetical protein
MPAASLILRSAASALVYDAPWYQPPILPKEVIAHPAPRTRARNANQMLILFCCSLAYRHPLIDVLRL